MTWATASDLHAVALDGDEIRRRGNVPIPDVVADFLEVPETLAGQRIEGDNAIAEEIVAGVAHAEVVGFRRAGRDEGNAARFIQGHAAPAIRAVFDAAPGLVAVLAGVGFGLERPQERPGAHVVAEDIAKITGGDQYVLIDGGHGARGGGILVRPSSPKFTSFPPVFGSSA